MNSVVINLFNEIMQCVLFCITNSSKEKEYEVKNTSFNIKCFNSCCYEVRYKNKILLVVNTKDTPSCWYYNKDAIIFGTNVSKLELNNNPLDEPITLNDFLYESDDDLESLYFNHSTKGITLMPESSFKFICSLRHIVRGYLYDTSVVKSILIYNDDFVDFCDQLDIQSSVPEFVPVSTKKSVPNSASIRQLLQPQFSSTNSGSKSSFDDYFIRMLNDDEDKYGN